MGGEVGAGKHSGDKPVARRGFYGKAPEEDADPAQEGSDPLGGLEGRLEGRTEGRMRAGGWTTGMN